MKTYAQYCPIARTSEILAQRWTPIIVRNLLNGRPATAASPTKHQEYPGVSSPAASENSNQPH